MKPKEKQELVRKFFHKQEQCPNIRWESGAMHVKRAVCGLTDKSCTYNNCPNTKKL